MFGVTSNLLFLFHEQDISSSGVILANTGKSMRVSWDAKSSGGICRITLSSPLILFKEQLLGRLCDLRCLFLRVPELQDLKS